LLELMQCREDVVNDALETIDWQSRRAIPGSEHR
jgi:hypothetical protein